MSTSELDELKLGFDASLPGERRFSASGFLGALVEEGRLKQIAAARLADNARPVRLILFDKSETLNWTLGWHQDRVIAVKERAEIKGFENWSHKCNAVHVEPPFSVIQRMVTVRLHCDDCTLSNGALEVVRGSHLLGKLNDAETRRAVDVGECAPLECKAGDAIVLSTSIIHRSRPSKFSSHRRVIHVDYADFNLPAPLEWAYELQTAASSFP